MAFARARPGSLSVWAAALLTGLAIAATTAVARDGPDRPSFVLIVTDDEDVAIHEFMPKTRALIEDQGARFQNFFVSYPFCCPSRASILRGQYAHNTGLVGNEPPWGGYEMFHELGLESSTLATWLQDAGYRTAMVGKYLNRYVPARDGVPAGWSEWYVGGNAHASYGYALNENGRVVQYGDAPADYLNDVLTRNAVQVVRRAARAGDPFFLYVLPYIPHSPSMAAPRHADLFAQAKLPRRPAFDEADVGDKPALIRALPRLDGARIAGLEAEYRRRLRSLQAIDDMVERLIGTLEANGVLDETYVIYSSDNGFHMGEHRLPAGKVFPYEEDIRVPFAIRGPGIPEGRVVEALAVNIDIAPTIAALAGVELPDFVDGRSLLPLLAGSPSAWRTSFLIERQQLETQIRKLAERQGMTPGQIERAAVFRGLRTVDSVYVEHATGERELYDLSADPHQLANLAGEAEPALLAALSARLSELATCAGAECRRLEDLPIAPALRLVTEEPSGGALTPAAAQN